MNFSLPPPSSPGSTMYAPPGMAVAPPPPSPLFGVVISGCPVRTDFVQVDATKFACRLTCPGDIPPPLSEVAELALLVLQPLPVDHGVLCYWQLTPVAATAAAPGAQPSGFVLLGALTTEKPSQIFYTGWGEHEQMLSTYSSTDAASVVPSVLTLGLSLEPMSTITNILSNNSPSTTAGRQHNRAYIAQKIASDLFQFLQSFDTGTAGPGNMVVPNNIFDRWYTRFQNRLKHNPSFFLKNE